MRGQGPLHGYCVEFSNHERFVPDKMQPNDFRHWAGCAVSEVTTHRVSHHLSQFVERLALSGNGMPERNGDKTAVGRVLGDFEDDLTHKPIIASA